MKSAFGFVVPVLGLAIGGCALQPAATPTPGSTGSSLFSNFGEYTRRVTTDSPEAQAWFNQGMKLLYGFNHDEAIRSFKEAAAIDPDCAMAWWGVAYAHGININDPAMNKERSREAQRAALKAQQLIDHETPREVALINAIAERYDWPAPKDRTYLDQAYADAMGEAWRQFPNDPDIGALYAESLMNLQPWDYWTPSGEPKGRILEVVATLESVLAMRPDHPGANHFYIHAVEASNSPERAEAAADRLIDLVPGAGHLVHMPSHIYVRVGRYSDAADSNAAAIRADDSYMGVAPEPRFYWLYYAHNQHFLAYASMMEGRYETAMAAAREMERVVPEFFLRDFGNAIEGIMATPFHVLIRFGKWDDVLKEPVRPDYRLVTNAVRHYARGIAYSALGRTAEARREVELFEKAAAAIPSDWWVFNNKIDTVLPIARHMLQGELLFREGRRSEAFEHLRQAVAYEDSLVYDEPPAWMLPVRHALGALLMSDGQYGEAEKVYREDLRKNPKNGWGLLGLQQALRAQGRDSEAAELDDALAAAWRRRDVSPTSSCYCEPGPVASN